MKKMKKFLAIILMITMIMNLAPLSAKAEGISKDKTAEWSDDSQTVADVTLSVPGEETDVSSDIVLIVGEGSALKHEYFVELLHKMVVATDGTPTKIKVGLVTYADTTEDEIVLPLSEMVDTVPGNTVKELSPSSSETKSAYEARIAAAVAENPDLVNDMDFLIARALHIAATASSGVNMDSALVTARDMLAADTEVPAERKHMIVFSTGLTYTFDSEAGDFSVTLRKSGTSTQFVNFKFWQSQRHNSTSGGYRIPQAYVDKHTANGVSDYKAAWLEYWEDVVEWIEKDQNAYVYTPGVGDTFTAFVNRLIDKKYYLLQGEDLTKAAGKTAPSTAGTSPLTDANAQHAVGYERAQYEAWLIYKQMETPIGQNVTSVLKDENGNNYVYPGQGFNCYALVAGKTPGMGEDDLWLQANQIGYNFMFMLGGEHAANFRENDTTFFNSIANKILYSVSAGSYVEDYIGYENNANDGYNFDFMVDGKITLSVGATEYITNKLETAKDGFDASYTFTAPGAETATFTLDYYKGNGTTEEKFIWTFGEDIQNFAPASLNYQVKLVECRMPETLAANGYIVETNQNATLYPKDGEAEAFPVPKLTVLPKYTVTYEYVGVIPEGAPAVPAAKDYLAGVNVTTADKPAMEGYTFYGWQNPHTADVNFAMPAHDITITGYWMPNNNHVDPPIGIKTDKEKGENYQYDVTVSVPGDGEEVKIHDEVIMVIDGSYSMDEEWEVMKQHIVKIAKNVLGGAGRTQLTVLTYGMGDNIVVEGIKTVAELEEKLPALPGGLLYGVSSTNCESGFTGAMEYIESKRAELSKVDVIYISDFGVNTDETPRVFGDWKTLVKTAKLVSNSAVVLGQSSLELSLAYGTKQPAIYTELFGEMDPAKVLEKDYFLNISEDTLIKWLDGVYAEVFGYSGLELDKEYPISDVERAFVKYDKENGTYLRYTFYYLQKNNTVSDKYPTRWERSIAAGNQLAAMDIVNELYLLRYAGHSQGWWAKDVIGAKYYSTDSVADLDTVITPMANTLSKTNYTNVVITDYMSKWVILDQTSIYVKNDTTGEIIWTITDGWRSENDRPTTANPVVKVELVPASEYEAGGDDVIGNTNGEIYKLTWYVKDDCLLRTDNYSLHYVVTVDIDEPGFIPGEEFPANGNTYVDYEVGGHNPIDVPNVTIPAYTVTYLNGEIVLQATDSHKTGDVIPVCEEPESYVLGELRYTFAGWKLRSGIEGDDNTVGTTDLVYEAVYTVTSIETSTEEPTESTEESTEPTEESTELTEEPTESTEETTEESTEEETENFEEETDVPLGDKPVVDETPETGDARFAWLLAVLVSGMCMIAIVIKKKELNK